MTRCVSRCMPLVLWGSHTVGENEPEYAKRSAYPGNTETLLIVGNTIEDACPILTGEYLVHAKEGVVYVEERDTNCFAIIVVFWQFSSKKLRGEDRREEG
jgi:hypothetical protein